MIPKKTAPATAAWKSPFWRNKTRGADIQPPALPETLKRRLADLADRYETAAFSDGDPSCVLRRYRNRADTECAALLAALLAFGRREQFLAKTGAILAEAGASGGPVRWLKEKHYAHSFPGRGARAQKKFYRFYSYADLRALFDRLHEILLHKGSLGAFFRERLQAEREAAQTAGKDAPLPAEVLARCFPDCALVPQGKNTANKRLNLFLRWMVRRGSPVDAGLWDWISPAELVIPLDTHVLQEAARLGLLPPGSPGNRKTACLLTGVFRQIWPQDPCRGDFALFGLGTDSADTEDTP